MKSPVERNYGYNYINYEKTHEYNGYIRDVLKNDDDMRKRAAKQLSDNVDSLVQELIEYHG